MVQYYMEWLARQQSDLVIRSIPVTGPGGSEEMLLVYAHTLVDKQLLQFHVIDPLLTAGSAEIIQRLPVGGIRQVEQLEMAVQCIMKGDPVLLRPGQQALVIYLRSWPHRSISEPDMEPGGTGPREAFTEVLTTNLALVRRRLPDASLRMEMVHAGSVTNTEVVILSLEGRSDPRVLQEVRERLKALKSREIIDVSGAAVVLEDPPASLLPTIQKSERPDTVVRGLLEGRVAVLCDGSVQGLLIPGIFLHQLQAPDDYYQKPHITPFTQFLRFVAINLSVFVPSIYVAVLSYHPDALPTTLLAGVAAAREGVPFPSVLEALGMTLTFELLREAGLRMPKPVGSAITIVGGLVIGEAAIRANLTSPAMVIVVSLTAIAAFAVPGVELVSTLLYLRFLGILLAGVLGFVGVLFTYLAALTYFNVIEPYGYPYLFPLTPLWPDRLAERAGLPSSRSTRYDWEGQQRWAHEREQEGWRIP